MKRTLILSTVAVLAASACFVRADETEDLKKLRAELRMQQQELKGLLSRMEEMESGKEKTAATLKKMSWAENIKLKGDIRYRYEWGENEAFGANAAKSADRERIRARLGIEGKVNDQMDFGIRLVTEHGNATSTNRTLDQNRFDGKPVFFDLAYVTWKPEMVDGLGLTVGKMKRPWVEVSDLIIDGDVNPEGLAATYTTKMSDSMTLMGSGGSFIYDSDNNRTDGNDVRLNTLQIAAKAKVSENLDLLAGAGVLKFSNTSAAKGPANLADNNTERAFGMYNLFVSAGIKGLPLPLTVYGDYVVNNKADDDDTGYLVGFKTKHGKWSFDYNYRHLELNAVPARLNDGDFFNGYTGGEGHKFKVGYAIGMNWSLGGTYFMAKAIDNANTRNLEKADLLQLDIAAKF